MRLDLSYSPKQGFVFATVFFLMSLGAAYLLWYVPANTASLQARQFRALQTLEKNAREKADNSLELLKTLMRAVKTDGKGRIDDKQVRDYIKDYPTDNYTLSTDTQASKHTAAEKEQRTTPGRSQAQTILNEGPSFSLDENGLTIRLKQKAEVLEISYTLEQLFGPLLRKDAFDEYLVFKGDVVVYQTFPSGVSVVVRDSLRTGKSPFSATPVKPITLSGTAYKMFCHQISFAPGCELTVSGLLTEAHYVTQRNKLPEPLVLALFLIAVSVILAVPWIKIYQIGSQDRLTSVDGIFILAVPMLLTSILLFTFLQYNMHLIPGQDGFRFGAETIGGKIKQNVCKEMKRTYAALKLADQCINADQKNSPDSINSWSFPQPVQADLYRSLGHDSSILIHQVIQLDSSGNEKHNWTPAGNPVPRGDYRNRNYIRQLAAGRSYLLGYEDAFMLEPVISRTSGLFTTVMAMRSLQGRKNTFTVMSFDLQSLKSPLMTPGYAFAVIDADGKVLYHSDPARQLNENLLEETEDRQVLSSAIHANRDTAVATEYSGKPFKMFATPMEGLPLTLVIMEDAAYSRTLLQNQFFFCFSMMFGFFAILGLELILIFAVSIRPAYYKKHYFDVSWIGPDDRFQHDYQLAFYGNVLVVLACIACSGFGLSFFEYFFIFLSAASLSYMFQNALYAVSYHKSMDSRKKLKVYSLYAMVSVLLIFDITAFAMGQLWTVPLFQIILGSALYALFKVYARKKSLYRFVSRLAASDFTASFSLMTFSRLMVTSGVSVFFFYITIDNYNIKLLTRYRQSHFITQLSDKGITDSAGLKRQAVYLDDVWIDAVRFPEEVKDTVNEDRNNGLAIRLFQLLTMNNDDLLPDISGLSQLPEDDSWYFSSIFKGGKGLSRNRLSNGAYCQLSSRDLRYELPGLFSYNSYKSWIFWLLFIITLVTFWYMFHHILRRLFAQNLPKEQGWENIDEAILNDQVTNKLIFMIGAPGSGKLTKVKTLIDGGFKGYADTSLNLDEQQMTDGNVFVADMFLIPNELDNTEAKDAWDTMVAELLKDKYKLIVVNQFEYDIKNPNSNRTKLNLLESILEKKSAKVIIISTVHPVNFLDSINQQKESEAPGGTRTNPEHELERWHVLLGHFRIVIQPLVNDSPDLNDLRNWRKTFQHETRAGLMLNELRAPVRTINKALKDAHITGDALTLKLGITAHYFYMYIWQSLTKEEKFLLYDLAEDGLINPYDDYNIVLLISKGLIIRRHGVLRLFNNGFREFILTAIGKSEADLIQQEIKDNGNWNKLRTPLTLLIITVLAFLFTSQKEAYTDLLRYLTIIPLGLTAAMKVIDLFKPGTKTTNT
ncbi:cache domain-containing protein [Mucilaginibacter sp. CAU 1740]|uniref:PDC sensor domain-containing protein n=1 Tax=Mucilaginibacter sp. CAU 1740 TaxID=3140365 RepID=UPI00325B1CC8